MMIRMSIRLGRQVGQPGFQSLDDTLEIAFKRLSLIFL